MVTTAPIRPEARTHPAPEAEPHAAVPTPTQKLAGAYAFLLGASVLASAFDPNLSPRAQSVLFWSGLALSLAATVAIGLRHGARDGERMAALAGFGALLYLPYVLRSPEYAIFSDELDQRRAVRLLAETGHTPDQFPGLDAVTLWLHDTTGIGLDELARVVPLAVHGTVPLLVFGIATAIGLSGRTSFLASLLYQANPAFFFLHSAFTTETLGILFFLAAWGVVAACARDQRATAAYVPAIVTCLAGGVISDHLSALATAIGFVVLAVVTAVLYRRAAADAFMLAAASIVLLNGWLLLHATAAGDYVTATFTGRIDALVDALNLQQDAHGELFTPGALTPIERFMGYAYPAIVVLLCFAGILVLVQRRRPRRLGPVLVALLILGPGLWTLTAPAVVGGASELAYRAWPFFFLGMALAAGLGVGALDGLRAVPRGVRLAAVVGIVTVVIAGGIVIGDNEGGRFPKPAPTTAAGPDSVSRDAIAAAQWLRLTAGPNHRFVGDQGSSVVFAAFGDQQPVSRGSWLPFVARTPQDIARQLKDRRAAYVVVDRRITELPPRFGYYFAPDERLGTARGRPFPAAQLRKLDQVATRSLIYDNGNIAIYGPAATAGGTG